MNEEPNVVIRIDGNGHVYWPGETISGEYWVESLDAAGWRVSKGEGLFPRPQ